MKLYSFSRSYTVRTDEVDGEGVSFLAAIGNFLQNTAHLHANSLSFGVHDLGRDGKTWMLSRMALKVKRPPRYGETVTVETWPTGIDKLFALREFRLTTEGDEELVLGTSGWLIIDVGQRRILRIPDRFREFGQNPRALASAFPKIGEALGQVTHEKSFPVRFRDIDINSHVNSVAYFEWITEALPAGLQSSSFCADFEINYLKEAFYGETIVSRAVSSDGDPARFIHSLAKSDGEEIARARTTWKPREKPAH